MSTSVQSDVLIIGAGIVGASCAAFLSEQGVKVTLLEAQVAPAMGSTGRSAAGVRVQYTEEVNIRLSWESIQEYQYFQEKYGEDAGYLPIGYLFLVPPERWDEQLMSVRLQERLGVPVNALELDAAQRIVAFDTTGIAGVTYGPVDGIVDPHRVTLTYLRLAKEHGATLHVNTPLLRAQRIANVWRVETPKGNFEAKYILNAAGAWADQIRSRAGLTMPIPVQPVRRMIYMTAPTPWHHVYPLTIDLVSGFYLRSEGGRILFGRSNPDEPPGFTEGMDWNWFEQTLSVGIERFPWLEETQLDSNACWWGYYEVTPDHNPILGSMPEVTNWINAVGFSGHGVQQAPAVGRLMAEEIIYGRARSINIDSLRITRFADGLQRHERNIV